MVRYTLKGDANIDGIVDFKDLVSLAQNYDATYDPTGAAGPKLWSQGDANYDGITDFKDLVSLAQNYNRSALTNLQASSFDAGFLADFRLAQALAPEPTTLAALGGFLGLAMRRRAR